MRQTFLVVALAIVAACGAAEPEVDGDLDAAMATLFDETVALAQLYEASGDYRRAARLYEDARRLRKDGAYVLQQLTRIYRRTQDDRKLVDIYVTLVQLQPASVSWLRQLGSCYFRLGERKKAEAAWQRLLDVYPQRSSALRYLASIYAQHKLYAKAIATYQEASGLSPQDDELRLRLAETQHAGGDPLGALVSVSAIRNATSSDRSRRSAGVRREAVVALDLSPAVQMGLQKKLHEGPTTAADLAWFLATLCEERRHGKDAARFYRRLATIEPQSERGKRAAARAVALDPPKKD